VLFCGLFPLDQAPAWLLYLSKIFPLTYAADALKNVMLKGNGLDKCIPDLVILAGFALIFLFLNIFALKKYRKI
jgi:ABC-2 type transport system permease protein